MSAFLKRYWMEAQGVLSQLSVTAQWLIATTILLGVLLVGILVFFASSREMVPISGFADGRSEQIIARLQTAGIKVKEVNGRVMVPAERRADALAALVQDDLMRDDASAAFDQLLSENSSPWQTDAQGKRAYLIAKQKFLSQVLAKLHHVESAEVVLSYPENQGFGRNFDRPSASVNVLLSGKERMDKAMVEAVAGLVAGSIAEMMPQDVVVVDAKHGRRHMVTDEDDVMPGDRYELIAKQERNYRNKIHEALAYIPKVIVAVNVQTNSTRREAIETWDYDKNQPLSMESSRDEERISSQQGGEPGARPNVGLTIESDTAAGTRETISDTQTAFMQPSLVKRAQREVIGQVVESVNVSINVPRGFFVRIWKARNPEAEEEPTDADLQPIMAEQLQMIEQQIEPLIVAESDSQLRVAMYPDETLMPMTAGSGLGGGLTDMLDSPLLKPATVLLLGLISIGLMLGIVRKATTREALPTVEELAGLPPELPDDEYLVGEVHEAEASMAGVEVDEEELASRRIADQIADLIKANPDEAGGLIGKWVRSDE